MDFLKIKLLKDGRVYILQRTKQGVEWESWLEPSLAVRFIKHLMRGHSCQLCGETVTLLKQCGNKILCEVCWSEQ